MMELTKEFMQDIIKGRGFGVAPSAVEEMASQLLAGMEQEPVGEVVLGDYDDCGDYPDAKVVCTAAQGQADWNNFRNGTRLYAEPRLPQPVPDKLLAAMEEVLRISDRDHEAWHRAREGIADYRAAMLGAEPVSQHPDLTVWYGSMPETNGKSNWTAILHRKGDGIQDGITINRSEYPDRVLYAADRVRYLIGEKPDRPYILDYDVDKHSGYVKPVSQSDELPMDYLHGHKDGLEWAARLAEANHPQTGDWLYDDPLELAKAIRKGPDMPAEPMHGWIPCSERMPETMVSVLATGDWFDYAVTAWSGKEWLDFDDYEPPVTHWMPLPAAPQQEVR